MKTELQPRGHVRRGFARLPVEPARRQLVSEPGDLAPGKGPRALFDQRDRFGEGSVATQMFHDLTVTDGLHRRFVFRQATAEELFRFGHQPALEHLVDARVNARAEVGARALESEER